MVGDIFAAPGAPKVLEALRKDHRPAGVLLVVLNHAGDVIGANLALEMARKQGLNVRMLLTHEDIAPGADSPAADRRGLVGCIPLYKIAGAAAEAGLDLERVYALAERFNRNMATLAVAMKTATHRHGPVDLRLARRPNGDRHGAARRGRHRPQQAPDGRRDGPARCSTGWWPPSAPAAATACW